MAIAQRSTLGLSTQMDLHRSHLRTAYKKSVQLRLGSFDWVAYAVTMPSDWIGLVPLERDRLFLQSSFSLLI